MTPSTLFHDQVQDRTAHAPAYDWYADRYQAIMVSRNRWLVTALVSLGLALAQAGALLCLTPLKTSVPFLIKEETSGAVTTVLPLTGDASTRRYQRVLRPGQASLILMQAPHPETELTPFVAIAISSPAFDPAMTAS